MSADNWCYCPQCKKMNEAEFLRMRAAVEESYGKIPPEDYVKAVSELKVPDGEETLREDYELGIDSDGLFYVSYSASCERCGFSHSFKTEQALLLKGQSP